MLEKATKDDIASFQAFTIRNLDSKLSTESDTDQYKTCYVYSPRNVGALAWPALLNA